MATTLIIDLVGHDNEFGAAALEAWRATQRFEAVTVVALDGGYLAGVAHGCAVVTMRQVNGPRALGWAGALQTVATASVLLLTGPAEVVLGWEAPLPNLTELRSYAPEPVHGASFKLTDYARVRGFNTRLARGADLLHDLFSRLAMAGIRVAERPATTITGPVCYNLPVWVSRPALAPPVASILIVGSTSGERAEEVLLAAQGQSIDDVDIHVLDPSGGFDQDWVAEHSLSIRPRYGAWGTVTSHRVTHEQDWWTAIGALSGIWTLIIDASDVLFPWAIEVLLKHLRPGAEAVSGVRVAYDDGSGTVLTAVDPTAGKVGMVLTSRLKEWAPRTVAGAQALFEAVAGASTQQNPMAVALTARPGLTANDDVWRVPWAMEPVDAVRSCLPDRFGTRSITIRQNCLAKVDELDAYDRIDSLVAEFDGTGRLLHEAVVLSPCTWQDMARMSRGGFSYEAALGSPAGPSEMDRAVARRERAAGVAGMSHSGREAVTQVSLDPPASGWVFSRERSGAVAAMTYAERGAR